MRKSLAVGLLLGLLATVPLAKAQEEPSKFDLYGGFYYARINVNANVPGMAPSATYIGKGGGGQSEYNVNNWLGVVGDMAGFYATSAGNGAFAGAFLTYLAGPRVNFRHGKFTPFVQTLFGGVRSTDGIRQSTAPKITLP